MVNEVIPGINADYVDPVIDDGFHVMMEKFENAESGCEEKQPLKNFVDGDVENALGPGPGR